MVLSLIPVQIMIVTDISIYMSSEKGFIAFQKVSVFFDIHELFTKKIFRHYQLFSYINSKHSACRYNAYQLFKCN